MQGSLKHYKWKELFLGQTASFSAIITEEMLEGFYAITGDHSPIHVNREYALAHGFADRVVYGMLTASFLSTLAGVYLPGEHALLQQVESAFLRPVYPGDSLTISGEITELFDAFQQVSIKASVKNQRGEKVLRAKMKVGVRKE